MNLNIRLARIEEFETALELLRNAALWLKSKHIDHWQNWINPSEIYVNWIKEGFELEQFYFILNNETIIGMFRLLWEDELFWGKQENNAGYIHSFTIDRKYYGFGIGTKVLNMVENICRENNKKYLRLDCGARNNGLSKYYEDYGFKQLGIIEVYNEQLQLYEKELV